MCIVLAFQQGNVIFLPGEIFRLMPGVVPRMYRTESQAIPVQGAASCSGSGLITPGPVLPKLQHLVEVYICMATATHLVYAFSRG